MLWGLVALVLLFLVTTRDRVAEAWPPQTSGTDYWHLVNNDSAINPNWQVTDWYVDGQNASANAFDGNPCTSAAAPCLTWSEITDHRWACPAAGANCPRLAQNTTIHVLSSMLSSDAPITIGGTLQSGAYFAIVGTPTTVSTLTLSSVVAKNRSTPQLLNATLNGSAAVGQWIANTTHPSGAFAYRSLGANAFAITQPLTRLTIPFGGIPTEVNTWANGDSVTLQTFPDVVIASIAITSASPNTSIAYLQNVNVNRVAGATFNIGGTSAHIYEESSIGASLSNNDPAFAPYDVINCDLYGPFINIAQYQGGGSFSLFGGDIRNAATTCINCNPDLDFILGSTAYGTWTALETTYIDSGKALQVGPGDQSLLGNSVAGGAGIVWGPGQVQIVGTGRLKYPSGAGAAAASFLQTGAWSVNAQTKACIAQPGAAAIGACNTTVSAANLDTNAGATAGCLVALGGGSVCNYGP